MERYLLFIRDTGRDDETDIHESEAAARKALATYVRERSPKAEGLDPLNDDIVIDAYFSRDEADYVIARIRKPAARGEEVA
jgi:hypothetical protein